MYLPKGKRSHSCHCSSVCHMSFFFPLAAFKIVSVPFILSNLIMMCFGVVFFMLGICFWCFVLFLFLQRRRRLGVLWRLFFCCCSLFCFPLFDLWVCRFYPLGKFARYSFKYLFSTSPCSRTPIACILDLLKLFHISLLLCF